ncbi:8365_t:CDS:2 [Scutellospora calospora]|uniref:8365_t:CDS:1 n=1 Tax=Scutellospora calospora TaxID=85575 RepID=A0ACA9JZ66_9GLOM|nr:8365_t:CDS:2 [Scutellospora calospora]
MSTSISNQFSKDWMMPWEGTTNSIRIRDIVIARELLNYLDNGPKFINVETAKSIINKGGVISRYFIQRLQSSFGDIDPELFDEKAKHIPDTKANKY